MTDGGLGMRAMACRIFSASAGEIGVVLIGMEKSVLVWRGSPSGRALGSRPAA
jgi:hypothetical protein